jgi:hypothetical protein
MMYAASGGAKMIVAPISIGVLMYFFAGKLFSFITPGYQPEPGMINIKGGHCWCHCLSFDAVYWNDSFCD